MLTVRGLVSEMGLELTTGDEGADAPVRWVHISELPDPTPWLSGGELLLTTGIQLDSEKRQREFVRLLAGHHLAGLGFGTGFDHENVPAGVAAEAEELGFPVFEVPYELPFIALTEKAFTRLVNEQYEVLQRGIAIHKRLERLVLEESGLDEVVRALAAATGGAVCVFSGRGETISSKAFRRALPEEALEHVRQEVIRRGEELSNGASRASDNAEFAPDHPEIAGRALVLPVSLRGRGAPQAWLVAARDTGGPRRLRAADPPAGRDGRGTRADAPARDARHRAAPRRRRARGGAHRAALRGGAGDAAAPVRHRPQRRRAGLQRERRRAGGAHRGRARPLPGRRGHRRAGGHARAPAVRRGRRPRRTWTRWRWPDARATRSPGDGPGLRAAASRAAPVGSLRRTFHEARCALEAAALANGSSPAVASYRDLGAFQLLLSLQDDDALRLYCDSVLGPLEDASGEYGDELIRSLEAFIEQNGQWEKAARELFCHRHTLRYRIRRVEQLTGRDLSSARDRIEFWLALRARSW